MPRIEGAYFRPPSDKPASLWEWVTFSAASFFCLPLTKPPSLHLMPGGDKARSLCPIFIRSRRARIMRIPLVEKKLIAIADVQTMVSMSRSAIYRRIPLGEFPKPVSIGPSRVRWVVAEIEEWISCRIKERDGVSQTSYAETDTLLARDDLPQLLLDIMANSSVSQTPSCTRHRAMRTCQ